MVAILVSFGEGLFLDAMLVSGSVSDDACMVTSLLWERGQPKVYTASPKLQKTVLVFTTPVPSMGLIYIYIYIYRQYMIVFNGNMW